MATPSSGANAVLAANRDNYETLYAAKGAFLRYPADWVIRYHNMRLRGRMPDGAKALDYGCGGGNNSVFLMQQGFEVYGVDVAPSFKGLVSENLALHRLPAEAAERFSLIEPGSTRLPFADATFDFILSNQVLYYLPSREHIKAVAAELHRVTKPGGQVLFTMMGPRNYYITHHLKAVVGNIYDCRVDIPGHRLEGVRELIYIVRDEDELRDLFDAFICESVGYFDQSMFDLRSNFHWIFAGEKPLLA